MTNVASLGPICTALTSQFSRLGSADSAEVLAAAETIKRLIQGAGCDWNDLRRAVKDGVVHAVDMERLGANPGRAPEIGRQLEALLTTHREFLTPHELRRFTLLNDVWLAGKPLSNGQRIKIWKTYSRLVEGDAA